MYNLNDEELLSAYLDGEVTGEQQQRVEQRLADDAAYRQLHDELRALRQHLEGLPSHRLEPEFAQAVLDAAERQMLSPRRAEDEDDHAASSPRRWLRPLIWSGLTVAAALLFMFVGPSLQKPPEMARHEALAPPAAASKTAASRDAADADNQQVATARGVEGATDRNSSGAFPRQGSDVEQTAGQSANLETRDVGSISATPATPPAEEFSARSKSEAKSADSPRGPLSRGVAVDDSIQDQKSKAPASTPAGAAAPGGAGERSSKVGPSSVSGGKLATREQGKSGATDGESASGAIAQRQGPSPVVLSISVATSAEADQRQSFERLLPTARAASTPEGDESGKESPDLRADVEKKVEKQIAAADKNDGDEKQFEPRGGEEGQSRIYQVDLTHDQLVDLLAQLRTRPAEFRLSPIGHALEPEVARRAAALALKNRPAKVADAPGAPTDKAGNKSAFADRKPSAGKGKRAVESRESGARALSKDASTPSPSPGASGDDTYRVRFVVRVMSGGPNPAASSIDSTKESTTKGAKESAKP